MRSEGVPVKIIGGTFLKFHYSLSLAFMFNSHMPREQSDSGVSQVYLLTKNNARFSERSRREVCLCFYGVHFAPELIQ